MATTNEIVLVVRWSVKYFFAPNSPIFREGFDEGRQLQNAMLLQANAKTSKHAYKGG